MRRNLLGCGFLVHTGDDRARSSGNHVPGNGKERYRAGTNSGLFRGEYSNLQTQLIEKHEARKKRLRKHLCQETRPDRLLFSLFHVRRSQRNQRATQAQLLCRFGGDRLFKAREKTFRCVRKYKGCLRLAGSSRRVEVPSPGRSCRLLSQRSGGRPIHFRSA